MDLLWPDSEEGAGRARLRNVLSELRRDFESAGAEPDAVITSTRTSIGIDASMIMTDVSQFEQLLGAAKKESSDAAVPLLQQAVDLSSSEFCSTLYDDWVIVERTRLLHLRHDALGLLASTLLGMGKNAEAEETARLLLREDPVSENAHNLVIAVRIATRDYSGARRQFAALEQVLEAELGTGPSDASRELIGSIPANGNTTKQSPVDKRPSITGVPPVTKKRESEAATQELTAASGRPHRLSSVLMATTVCVVAAAAWFAVSRLKGPAGTPSGSKTPPASAPATPHKPNWVFRYEPRPDETHSEPTAMGGTPDGGMIVTGFVRTTHNDVDFLTFKLSADGKLVWRARYNGTGNDVDRARAVFVDGSGNSYVTGDSDNGKGNGLSRLAGLDIVTVKYDNNGNELWVKRLNGSGDGDDRPREFRWAGGNYCVLGTVEAKVPGRPRPVSKAIVAAYSAEGKEVWRHVVEENSPDAITAVSMTSEENGAVMVCGQVAAESKMGVEQDIIVTYLSPQGKTISAARYGKRNGTDDVPARIASNSWNESWVVGVGHTPGMRSSSPRELMAVKYGVSGAFQWARSLGVGSDRLERIWSTSGSRYLRQSLLGETSDQVGNRRFWLLTANAEGSLAWATPVSGSPSEVIQPMMGTDAKLLCNSPGVSTWIAVPVVDPPVKNGGGPIGIMTARYNAEGHQVWRDTHYAGEAETLLARAMGFGKINDVFVAGQSYPNTAGAYPPSIVVLDYKE
jgi:DNA-binding SARP family transcriptional activator